MNNFLNSVFISLFLSLISIPTSAQKFKVSWGENQKFKFDYVDAILLPNKQSIVLRIVAKGAKTFGGLAQWDPIILLVDKNMETIIEKPVDIEGNSTKIKGLYKHGDNIFFMYSTYNNKNKTSSFYALKIDQTTLNIISKISFGTFESENEDNQAKFKYDVSTDSSKIFFMAEWPRKKTENQRLFLAIYDTDLKNIWNKEVDLGMEQRFVKIEDEDVTNSGKVYISLKHYENETSKETIKDKDGEKVPSYVYKLYSFDGMEEKIIKLELPDLFINGTKLIYNKDGIITIGGLYKRKHKGNLAGIFYCTLDSKTSEINAPKIIDFPSSILELVEKDGFGSSKGKTPGLSDKFNIKHIVFRNNNSVDLISEYYRFNLSTNSGRNGTGTSISYEYYYGDIINTNISQSGEVVFTRIPKNQRFINYNGFLGFAPIIYKDKLILLYNDDEDNIDRDLDKKPDDIKNFRNSSFIAAIIDAKGNLTRQEIFSHKDEDYITLPRLIQKASDNTYLISGNILNLFKKRTRYGVLTVK